VQIASAGYFALVAVLLAQALAGRAPLDLGGVLAALFWISLALVIGAGGVTLVRVARATRKQPA
jgi:hypothetical protein